MKYRPILFSAPMVRALLNGTKTQTRRVIKPQPTTIADIYRRGYDENNGKWLGEGCGDGRIRCPYGQPGDRLWVREAFRTVSEADALPPRDLTPAHRIWYEADAPHQPGFGRLRASMHMPRWASRITPEIVDIRVEKLQDISEEDAVAEGCTKNHNNYFLGGPHVTGGRKQMATSKQAYKDLWESINDPGSWDLNPEVWVVEFKKVTA
jgi:hypothetical protein